MSGYCEDDYIEVAAYTHGEKQLLRYISEFFSSSSSPPIKSLLLSKE